MAGQEREWSAYDRQQPGLSINGPGSMWKPVRVFNKDAVPMLLTFDTLSAAQAYVAGQTHELLTGVRRPAGDETGIEWRGAAGGEVGFVLVHTSPRMSWTRGLSSTPDCATGRSPAPEHVS